jgi:phosphofructokinase-like protein
MMRVGLLTGGGDCPGLNAVIRAVVLKGTRVYQDQFVGFKDGWRGLLQDEAIVLTEDNCRDLQGVGGTILGTSRTNPYSREDGVQRILATLKARTLDGLIAIGGDDTLGVAARLVDEGVNVVGVPKTIDNDLSGTDQTFGFDTAVQVATDAIDRLRTTAESHHRVMVCEVMGREAGWIATWAGIAGGAAVILVPERPFDIEEVCERIVARHRNGISFSLVVVAEGAIPKDRGEFEESTRPADEFGHPRLGGISNELAHEIEQRTGFEARVTILGHIQRGGTPTAFDRILATRYGIAAIDALHEGASGMMVSLSGNQIVRVPLSDATGSNRKVSDELLDQVVAPLLG